MDYETAGDVQEIINRVVAVLFPKYNSSRVLAVRSKGSTVRAYARIWSMPKVWQTALDIDAFYVIEVLSEHFDRLPHETKEKVIIHEIMHIPSTFSGAIVPHKFKSKCIDDRTVNKMYMEYTKILEEKPWLAQQE